MNSKLKKNIILISITVIAFSLRFYKLAENVPPLYVDEVSHYHYWQWLVSQHDLSISNLMWTGYSTIYSYTWFLGLTPLGVRLPATIYGSLIPLAVFFLAGSVYSLISRQSQASSLKSSMNLRLAGEPITYYLLPTLSAPLAAFIPWSFMISRIGHSHIPIMVIFVCLSAGWFLRARKLRDYLLANFFFLVAATFYPSMVVISPLILGYMIYVANRELLNVQRKRFWIINGGLILIILWLFFTKYEGGHRGLDLAIWRDVNVTAETDMYRGIARESKSSLLSFKAEPEMLANKLLFNKSVAVGREFLESYLSFFSPEWLFLKGDPVLRHSTGMAGAFNWWMAPFMIWGAVKMITGSHYHKITGSVNHESIKSLNHESMKTIKQYSNKVRYLFLIWILVSPIPAAITNDGSGYLLRAVTMLPFLTVLAAIGIVEGWFRVSSFQFQVFKLFKISWSKVYICVLTVIGTYSVYYFLFGYFHVYPSLAARSFEYGFKEVSDFQLEHENADMLVIWRGYYPNNYFRFWQRTPAEEFKQAPWETLHIGASVFNMAFENLYFSWPVKSEDLMTFIEESKIEYVVFPDDYLERFPEYGLDNLSLVETIYYPNREVAFEIYGVQLKIDN